VRFVSLNCKCSNIHLPWMCDSVRRGTAASRKRCPTRCAGTGDPSRGDWALPEGSEAAAAQAAALAAASSGWTCCICSRVVPGGLQNCEGCKTSRLVTEAAEAEARREAAHAAMHARAGKKKKAKGTRISLGELHAPTPSSGAWGLR
jgi:hypothetical protein